MSAVPTDNAPRAHALAYAALGLKVVPIGTGTKYPPMRAWQDAATTDPDTVNRWFKGKFHSAGVGIATGPQPDGRNVVALDLDEHNPTESGSETLDDLEATHGRLPDTVTATTGAGGKHRLFEVPGDLKVTNGKIGPGIDIRGAGGQVVAAPSTHPDTGRAYSWDDGYAPWDHEIASAPAWLLELLAPTPPEPTQARASLAGTMPAGELTPADIIRIGWNWHAELVGAGWTAHHHDSTSGDTHWTRPGKAARHGSSGVLHEPDGPLVVFSTDPELAGLRRTGNPTPGGGVACSPFAFYAAREHGGDTKAAARTIRAATTPRIAAQRIAAAAPTTATVPHSDVVVDLKLEIVDWEDLWSGVSHEDPIVDGVAYRGRWTFLAAPGKAGKSTYTAHLALAVQSGRDPFDNTPRDPIPVLYADAEMGRVDMHERLEELGLTPADLSNLHYTDLVPKLDAGAGAARLLHAVDRFNMA